MKSKALHLRIYTWAAKGRGWRVPREFILGLLRCRSVQRSVSFTEWHHGRRLRGLGDGPPKLEVGTAHAFVAPIFREVVLLDACESMNWVKEGVIYVIYQISEDKDRQKTDKIRSMIKKVIRNCRNCRRWNGILFPKNGHSKIWSRNFFGPPQTRCQVSAYEWHHWSLKPWRVTIDWSSESLRYELLLVCETYKVLTIQCMQCVRSKCLDKSAQGKCWLSNPLGGAEADWWRN